MNTGPAFWLIMIVGAAVLLGVALAYALISKRNRRENSIVQAVTTAASHGGRRQRSVR
jgi:LPS O-antigen subunit length determinant protein (WzzB/FepE family)